MPIELKSTKSAHMHPHNITVQRYIDTTTFQPMVRVIIDLAVEPLLDTVTEVSEQLLTAELGRMVADALRASANTVTESL